MKPEEFYQQLLSAGVDYFCGVPDSLLKDICAYFTDMAPPNQHIITANEGAAVGLAIGYHLATAKIPLVYLQNSGLGNVINPITSLADREVYACPMVLLIGWRGQPGTPDEPQHVKQGRVTPAVLDALDIPYVVLTSNTQPQDNALKSLISLSMEESKPVAVLVEKGSFEKYSLPNTSSGKYQWSREDAIRSIGDHLNDRTIVVATTGMASRELFEYRSETNSGHDRDFLTVGGMGHASQIALGIAQQKSDRDVVCLDGDGATIMHLGSLAIIGQSEVSNLTHFVLNNGAHDSVGGQPTVAFEISLCMVAEACGYAVTHSVENQESLHSVLSEIRTQQQVGPVFVEVKVDKGNRSDLGRPTTSPIENKRGFMRFLQHS
jgi:phosphonopyruvate decarboxylase